MSGKRSYTVKPKPNYLANAARFFRLGPKSKFATSKRKVTHTNIFKKSKPLKVRSNVTSQGTGVASSSNYSTTKVAKNKKAELLRQIGQTYIAVSQNTDQLVAQGGFQDYKFFNVMGAASLRAIATTIPFAGPSLQQQPSIAGVQNFGNLQALRNFVYEGCYGELLLTNATNHAVEVTIYEIICRRDEDVSGNSLTYNWRDNVTSGTVNNISATTANWKYPTGAMELGQALGNNSLNNSTSLSYPTNTGNADLNIVGSNPKDSKIFRDWYKIVKQVDVQMPLGATHRHRYSYRVNKIMDQSVYADTNIYALKGFTRYIMYRVKGYPANYIAGTAGPDQVTTTPCLINSVITTRVKYTSVQSNQSILYQQDNLTSLATVNVMNTASGVSEPAENTL